MGAADVSAAAPGAPLLRISHHRIRDDPGCGRVASRAPATTRRAARARARARTLTHATQRRRAARTRAPPSRPTEPLPMLKHLLCSGGVASSLCACSHLPRRSCVLSPGWACVAGCRSYSTSCTRVCCITPSSVARARPPTHNAHGHGHARARAHAHAHASAPIARAHSLPCATGERVWRHRPLRPARARPLRARPCSLRGRWACCRDGRLLGRRHRACPGCIRSRCCGRPSRMD